MLCKQVIQSHTYMQYFEKLATNMTMAGNFEALLSQEYKMKS